MHIMKQIGFTKLS